MRAAVGFALLAQALLAPLAVSALPAVDGSGSSSGSRNASADAVSDHGVRYRPSNITLVSRRPSGHATHYAPSATTEGGPQSSCGNWMNDLTMGVALSKAGWSKFAKQGIPEAELCYKPILISAPDGSQHHAKIMDTCPPDTRTATCFDPCDIDLTTGLFKLMENPKLGIFPVTWSFLDGTPSGCGPTLSGSSSSSHAPQHSTSQHGHPHPSSSSTSKSTSTSPTSTSSPSSSPPSDSPFDPFAAMVSAAAEAVHGALHDGQVRSSGPHQAKPSAAAPQPQKAVASSRPASSTSRNDSIEDMLKALVAAVAHN